MSAGEPLRHERGPLSVVVSMARTRLELAATDLEAHVAATLAALAVGIVALVSGLIAFGFVGIAVIALFWDSHRVAATLATTAAYITLALVFLALARSRWKARPAPFDATLRELELDREALRVHP